jgi:predicted acylesterase/phospholipase RssA/CRP-like cAMP-binding protein
MMYTDDVDDANVDTLLHASSVFGLLSDDARAFVADELELRLVARGDVVMRQGDPADGLYLVASGRLQVTLGKDDGTTLVVGEVGRGEVTGEMALLTDKPRSATVTALRDSHVFFLSTAAFTRVVQTHPDALRVIASQVIDKLMATIRRGAATSPATTIVVVPLDETTAVREFGDRLARSLRTLVGPVFVVREHDARDALGSSATSLARAVWRDQLEAAHSAVLYEVSASFDAWTGECVQQGDMVLFVASARSGVRAREVEVALQRSEPGLAQRRELVLLHEPSAATPTPGRTREWLAGRRIDRHHHARTDRDGDYDRVARLLVGRGVGVVFSGGGARGIAHIGVLRALEEHGVTIDATAGASIGAIVAGSVARGDDADAVAALIRAAVVDRSPVDLTFPTVSFAAGGRVTQHIRAGSRGLDVEDTWLPFFCVSTNLTRGALEVHDRGAAWAAVRSSFAVPGLFPPMRNEDGDVLVDGGILDNLPVTPMRRAHNGITVMAIDVGARREFVSASVPTTGVVSGWRYLATNLRHRTLDNLTSLPRILMRLTELGSLGDDDQGDCYIRPALDGVSLLDFDRFDDLVERGYHGAAATLTMPDGDAGDIDLTNATSTSS